MTSRPVEDKAKQRPLWEAQATERLRQIAAQHAANRPVLTWSQSLWAKCDAAYRRVVSSAFYRFAIIPLWRWTFGRFLYVKSRDVASAEAAAMQFIRTRTSIPVPRPLCTFRWDGYAFLVMQRVSGQSLSAPLWNAFTEEEKCRVVGQLRGFVQQMRAIPPRPGAVIGSVLDGAQSTDYRLCEIPHGPYLDEDQMNHQLRMGLSLNHFPPMVIESHSRQHHLVFTHGDIAMRNIMVKGTRVVALIDWEGAGWYPAHWEYCKSHYGCKFYDGDDWRSRLCEFIPPYEFEKEADLELRKFQRCPDLPPVNLIAPHSPEDNVQAYFDQKSDPTRRSIKDSPLFSLVW